MVDRLPVEMLSHIMGFLPVVDRQEAALVNKHWYEASLDPALQKDTIISFPASTWSSQPLRHVARRRGVNLSLDNLDVFSSTSSADFLSTCQDLGPRLIELSLHSSDITEAMLVVLLSHCHQLEVLDLSCCNSLFMTGKVLAKQEDIQNLRNTLQKVSSLSLASIRYLSDVTFSRLVAICPNLQRLSLAGCQILFHTGAYIGPGKIGGNTAVLTWGTVQGYVQQQADKITSFNLSRTAVSDEALLNLCQTPNLELEELYLSSCKELTDRGIQHLCKLQRQLQVLDLSQNQDLTDAALQSLTQNMHSLQQLNLARVRQLTHVSVSHLADLPALASVNLSACLLLTTKSLQKGLCSPNSGALTQVVLSGCSNVEDSLVLRLCGHAVNLMHLDVSSCSRITDYSVHAISGLLPGLRVLRMAWCRELTDAGLLGVRRPEELVKRPPILQHDDGECSCTRKHHLSKIFNKPSKFKKIECPEKEGILDEPTMASLDNISCLKELDLAGCHQVTDASITKVMRFKELRKLSLAMCPKLTDASLIAMAKHAPSIQELDLSQCKQITDQGLTAVVKSMRRLVSLKVKNCDKLSNRLVDSLCIHASRLRHLDIAMCSGITPTAIEQLENHHPYLLQVNKRYIGTE